MVREKQSEQVPQWVRDFITQRQRQLYEEQHSEKDEKAQVDDNVYLLNPFNQDEVEAIRKGVWKLREEAALAKARENRRLREAGVLVGDSGFSLRDDFFETYFRPLLHTPLTRQEMQKALRKYYGWGNWSEDPWGDFSEFYKWMNSIHDDERDVWAINETYGGRVYFTYWIFNRLSQIDLSAFSERDLGKFIGYGGENFLCVKSYTAWEDFTRHFPKEPLPKALINEQIIKVYLTCPYRGFRWFINSVYLWLFAFEEFMERAKGHPELEAFLNYHAATDTQVAEICRKLAPKGYQPPDKNQAWVKLEQALKLEGKAGKYNDVYPLQSKHHDILKESYLTAQEGLLEGVNYWKSKAAQATIEGLKGSLLHIVENNFKDATRKAYRKHEVTESKIESTRITDDDTPFFDTRPSREPTPEELMLSKEPIDLKTLGFDKDELTPGELLLLKELEDASSKGYTKDSKEGLSLNQYWTDDKVYQRKMKMLKRLEAKRKKP